MKVIVTASPTFGDYRRFNRILHRLTVRLPEVELHVAHRDPAFPLVERWATENLTPYRIYRADIANLGVRAARFRNTEMVGDSDGILAFLRGETDLLRTARLAGIKVKFIQLEG